jgi:prepilin-type N-terminal cleavage/methylation domain-containing protein
MYEKESTMKEAVQKLKREAGFTFSEVLVAVTILVMISAAALPAALNAYRNAVDAANAHMLLSTTVEALRDELSTAWNVSVDSDAKTITYQSSDTGGQSLLSLASAPFTIQEYNDFDNK